ncbi:MAG: DUF3499 family protein [Candidatus Velamenicoccus archaeovorus]
MRVCDKLRCRTEAVATVGLSYEARVVVIGELSREPNPNLLDLCSEHVRRLTPPIGWYVRDERPVLAPNP